jgi:branched-chain amino acid transport system ATP-binding protein
MEIHIEERGVSPLLNIANLKIRYGMITALDQVSLSIDRGEIVVVLGPNGAGKSTLMGAIAGVHKPSTGEITLDAAPIPYGVPEKVLRLGVALIPEGRSIFGALTVEENLRLGGSRVSRSDVTDGIDKAFTRFPVLAERRNQSAGTLSGGEQQQLAIARALMSSPTVVLYDEPSLGLAPKIVTQIFELITELRDEGVTTVLVEQNVHLALDIADYGYVLASGHIVSHGYAAELASIDLAHLYMGIEAAE